jgi:hypothetical protein
MTLGSHIFDCGKFASMKPLVVREVPDGEGGTRGERLPLYAGFWGVDKNGNIAFIKTHNAAVQKAPNDGYAQTILSAKWRAGWVPLTECPQSTQHERWMPDASKGRPKCKVSTEGEPLVAGRQHSNRHCKCVGEIIAVRREQNVRREAQRDPGLTVQQKLLAETQRQNASASSSIDRLAAVMAEAFAAKVVPEPSAKGGK